MTQFVLLLVALVGPAVMAFSHRYEGRGESYIKPIFAVGFLAALATAVALVLVPAQAGTLWLEQQVPFASNNPSTNSTREMLKILCCFLLGAAAMTYFFAKLRPTHSSGALTTKAEVTSHAHAEDMIKSQRCCAQHQLIC